MEQLDYKLLFRWFVGLSLDAAVWDVTVFTKNRERPAKVATDDEHALPHHTDVLRRMTQRAFHQR
jgi:hypothetical protein